jgi:hypothetical protein
MDQKELKEAIFDMFRKSKETSNKPQAPVEKSIKADSLANKRSVTADEFREVDPNTPIDKLRSTFTSIYFSNNPKNREDLETLLDEEPYTQLKAAVEQDLKDIKQYFAKKQSEKSTSIPKPGASDTQSVRRSNSGFPGLSEEKHIYNKNTMTQEQLRMQMLAGIITEGQYKEKMDEAEGMSGKDFALQKIKPYLEKEGYKIGFFNDVSSIPMAKMKDDPTLAALTLDSRGDVTIVLPNDDKGQKILFTSTSNGELIKDLDLENHFSLNKRFYGDGLGLYLIAK